MPYQLIIEDRPGYLHAKATGARTPENALRFIAEAYAACVEKGRSALLLESNLTGPSLDTASIYRVILQKVEDGAKLAKIAYVVDSVDDPAMPVFAETVALNRGVNVRLFQGVEAAARWLSGEDYV
jgi:hypothetical protein